MSGPTVLILIGAIAATPPSAQLSNPIGGPNDHGSVRVEVDVNPEGQLTSCKVVRPSGVAALDSGACPMVQQRVRLTAGIKKTQLTVHFIVPHATQTAADLPIGPGEITILRDPARLAAYHGYNVSGPGKARPPSRLPISAMPKYPSAAAKVRLQGKTSVVVDINAKGRPTGCSVVRTSGHAELDSATCKFAQEHLRYKPGTDYYGKKIAGVDLFHLDWSLTK